MRERNEYKPKVLETLDDKRLELFSAVEAGLSKIRPEIAVHPEELLRHICDEFEASGGTLDADQQEKILDMIRAQGGFQHRLSGKEVAKAVFPDEEAVEEPS